MRLTVYHLKRILLCTNITCIIFYADSLSPNFERRNSQNNQRDRSSSDGALGLRKKFRPERRGINDNWRHPVDDKKEAGMSRTISNVETRLDSTKSQEKNSGENHQSNVKRNNSGQGTNNRNSTKRNVKQEEKKNSSEVEKNPRRSGNEGNYDARILYSCLN